MSTTKTNVFQRTVGLYKQAFDKKHPATAGLKKLAVALAKNQSILGAVKQAAPNLNDDEQAVAAYRLLRLTKAAAESKVAFYPGQVEAKFSPAIGKDPRIPPYERRNKPQMLELYNASQRALWDEMGLDYDSSTSYQEQEKARRRLGQQQSIKPNDDPDWRTVTTDLRPATAPVFPMKQKIRGRDKDVSTGKYREISPEFMIYAPEMTISGEDAASYYPGEPMQRPARPQQTAPTAPSEWNPLTAADSSGRTLAPPQSSAAPQQQHPNPFAKLPAWVAKSYERGGGSYSDPEQLNKAIAYWNSNYAAPLRGMSAADQNAYSKYREQGGTEAPTAWAARSATPQLVNSTGADFLNNYRQRIGLGSGVPAAPRQPQTQYASVQRPSYSAQPRQQPQAPATPGSPGFGATYHAGNSGYAVPGVGRRASNQALGAGRVGNAYTSSGMTTGGTFGSSVALGGAPANRFNQPAAPRRPFDEQKYKGPMVNGQHVNQDQFAQAWANRNNRPSPETQLARRQWL